MARAVGTAVTGCRTVRLLRPTAASSAEDQSCEHQPRAFQRPNHASSMSQLRVLDKRAPLSGEPSRHKEGVHSARREAYHRVERCFLRHTLLLALAIALWSPSVAFARHATACDDANPCGCCHGPDVPTPGCPAGCFDGSTDGAGGSSGAAGGVGTGGIAGTTGGLSGAGGNSGTVRSPSFTTRFYATHPSRSSN
jgi:hypothetical protein